MESDFSYRLMEMAARTMDDEQFAAAFSPEGLAPTATWSTEDDWIGSNGSLKRVTEVSKGGVGRSVSAGILQP